MPDPRRFSFARPRMERQASQFDPDADRELWMVKDTPTHSLIVSDRAPASEAKPLPTTKTQSLPLDLRGRPVNEPALQQAQPAPVPNELDLDRLLWRFWTTTDRRQELQPESPGSWIPAFDVPEVVTVGDPPPADDPEYWVAIPVRLPQFDEPNWWSIPFDAEGTVCIPFYQTPTTIIQFRIPQDRMVILTGASYQVEGLNPGDQIQVTVRRDGEQMAQWNDYYVLNTGSDPSSRWAFASHQSPFPLHIRYDHDQMLVVQVSILGPYPFTSTTPQTAFGHCATIQLHGYMPSLMDSRDGAPRPVDCGDWLDMPDDDATIDALADWISNVLRGCGEDQRKVLTPEQKQQLDALKQRAQHADQAAAQEQAAKDSKDEKTNRNKLALAAGLIAAGIITGTQT